MTFRDAHEGAMEDSMRKNLKKPETVQEWEALMLSFIGSLTLADHIGDVGHKINLVLQAIGVQIQWEDLSDLTKALGRRGVTTLYGTSLALDDEPDFPDAEDES